MKSLKTFILVLLVCSSLTGGAQEYSVGTSVSSIEPDQSLISLHLGGYGSPRDGRFSLQWKKQESLPQITAISGTSDKLYIISNGELLCRNLQANDPWKKAGKAENIIAVAVSNGKIYAASNDGELFETDANGKIRWKKVSSIDKSVTSLTASDNKLFAANDKGEIWSSGLSKGISDWSSVNSPEGIISLAFTGGKLYAMTNGGVIYWCEPDKKEVKWIKAAYKNNITIKEDIRYITIANKAMYGVSKDNILYEGEHRTEGNLSARALALKDNEKTVLIISVDVCGFNDSYLALIKKEINEKHKIPSSGVLINSSHTHFAPVSQYWYTWQEPNQIPDSTYLYSTIRNGILSAVDNAIAKMAPAQVYFGRGKTDIGFNRSLKEHPELYDSSVDVIKVKYKGSNEESYLFLASCHAVHSTAGTLHYTISANFPGVARKLLEERTGTSNSMFLQGTAGDINPRDNGEYITGEKLSNEVISVLNRPMTELTGGINYFLDTINIPAEPWSKDEIFAFREANSNKVGDVGAEKNVKWCDLMLKYYDDDKMPSSMPVYVNTINIGNWKLIGFSRETTTQYGFGVKNLWPEKLISVAGYTNDVSSYLPTTLHIKAANYEGRDSFFWYGMPNVFPLNVDQTILETIRDLNR